MVITKHGKYYNRIFKIDIHCTACECEFRIFGEWDTRHVCYYFPDIFYKSGYSEFVRCPDCGGEIYVNSDNCVEDDTLEACVEDDTLETIDNKNRNDISW